MKNTASVVLIVKEFAANLSEIVQDLLRIVIQVAFVNKVIFAMKMMNASSWKIVHVTETTRHFGIFSSKLLFS